LRQSAGSVEAPDEIEVVDPRHPLFGRRFRVVSVTHPPQGGGFVFVTLRDEIHLRISKEATSLATCNSSLPSTTITPAAVEQLVACFQEVEKSCRAANKRSGRGSRKASARKSSRNSR
jgi:hypothetical protein